VEVALSAGPFFAGERFSLVDAVFAPVFRYFDLFDELTEHGIFTNVPKVRAWRAELAKRPSVRSAVGADYPQLLRAFLVRHDAHLLKLAA
jgi:glutathione S-transferase